MKYSELFRKQLTLQNFSDFEKNFKIYIYLYNIIKIYLFDVLAFFLCLYLYKKYPAITIKNTTEKAITKNIQVLSDYSSESVTLTSYK